MILEKRKIVFYIGSLLISSLVISIPYFIPDLFILSWIGYIPWLLFLKDRTPRSSFFFSLFVGIIFFTSTMYWITTTIEQYGGLHISIALFLNVLLSFYLALYFGFFGFVFALIRKKYGINTALIVASSLWIITEWLRGHIFTGFPWNLTAYSQYLFLPIVQIGEFFGPYGLSWLIIAFNSALVFLIINGRKIKRIKLCVFPSIVFVLFLISIFYGISTIDNYPKDTKVHVALIQGNAGMENWTYDDCLRNMDKHSKMILGSSAKEQGLAILSETSLRGFGFYPGSSFAAGMKKLSTDSGMDILFGSSTVSISNRNEHKYYNSAVLVRPNDNMHQIYSKVHLVPFGEYIPFKKILFFVDKFSKGIIGDFSAGENYEVLVLSNGNKFGVGVCYELLFPELMRQFTKNGAEFLANITNDTWYGKTVMPRHHFSLSVFRAIENRKYVVRAANSGISGIVAPDGKVITKSELFSESIISSNIHPNNINTLYSMYGDWFIYLNFLIVLIEIIVLESRLRRKDKK